MSTEQLSADDANSADGEGVWSPEIEQAFQEALLLFPACGRRKHILQEEGGGKMYGRNELIARHIMMRTGKSRTRKQVSSHIQVLARRKAKTEAGGSHGSSQGSSLSATPSPSNNTRPQQPTIQQQQQQLHSHHHHNHLHHQLHHHHQIQQVNTTANVKRQPAEEPAGAQLAAGYYSTWLDRPIVTPKIRLVEFSAFIEYTQPHIPSQFNQISPFQSTISHINGNHTTNNLNETIHHQHHLATSQALPPAQLTASSNGLTNITNINNNNNNPHHNHLHQLPFSTTPSRLTRHSYVKIDYTQPIGRQTDKLERIDINQIQDKFPEIGGLDGLFQRGPADSFFLVKFWADLNNDHDYNIESQSSYFGFSSHFETIEPYETITCCTKACSYGIQVVEKEDNIYGVLNSTNGRYSYDINRSPMCEFMIQFIKKLRQLPRTSQMNSVLENFTVLQVITSESSAEILLCLAYIFEVAPPEQNNGPQYNVYKLTKDWTTIN